VAQTSTNKDLRTLEDLKGAVVGVAGLGSVNHLFFLNYLLLRHGLKPTDVRTVAIGVGSSAVAALEHKRVDAAVLVGNETEVALDRVAGLHILLDARGGLPTTCQGRRSGALPCDPGI
jgi:sulfonate transport system substrate-binding protein